MTEPRTQEDLPLSCDYEGSDYRTAFWEGQGREYEDLAERIAMRRLLPATGERLVDIGGGFGRLIDLYVGYKTVVLMDPSRSQLEYARARLGGGRIIFVAANVYAMPFARNAFDTVVTVRVLHHLTDVPSALGAIQHILQPHGSFVMEYANKRNLKALLRHAFGLQKHNPNSLEPYEFVPLNFDFHPAYMENSLQAAGFSIERRLSVSHFRVGFLKRHVPTRLLATWDGWLQEPTSALRMTPSLFLRARAPGGAPTGLPVEMFCCPSCQGELQAEANTLVCGACHRRWNTSGGIYDFRQPLEGAAA